MLRNTDDEVVELCKVRWELENTEHRRAVEPGHRPYDTAWLWRALGIEAPP